MGDTIEILGIKVDNLTREEALLRLEGYVALGGPHQVVTINPEFVVMAQDDSDFRAVLNNAVLGLPDGVGLTMVARLLGNPLRERIPGVDLVREIAGLSAGKGYRLFFLGGAGGVAEAAAERLRLECGTPIEVRTYAGSPAQEEEDHIIDLILQASPLFLFVAYGAPPHDLWISRNLHRLHVPVCMGVGGSFDYISGSVRRAPRCMQRMGLEWLFRLAREPWRCRRMLRLPRFLWLVLVSYFLQAKK